MAQWAVVIPADVWATERLFQHETLTVPVGGLGPAAPAVDDDVLLVAGELVVAQGRVVETGPGRVAVAYTRRAFDEPVPAALLQLADRSGERPVGGTATLGGAADRSGERPVGGTVAFGGASPFTALGAEVFAEVAARLGADSDKQTWLVSVALPIEATSPAEAVRLFWSYVQELGPAELPTYVWPSGDELAMQAFVLGEQANQDPEEEDED